MNAARGTSREERLLLIGASRGLGYAIAEEYLKLGWRVVATARPDSGAKLRRLAESSDGRLDVETVDINEPEQVAALRGRLSSRTFDLLFVNAGVKNDDRETIADVSTDEFVRVMVTNALSPMRVVESLQSLVSPAGTVAVMSSGQGSVANNTNGGYEVYREQGGLEHPHAELRVAPRRGRPGDAAAGSRLGPDGHGRSERAPQLA